MPAIVALLALVFWFRPPPEPDYQGRTVSECFYSLTSGDSTEQSHARTAIKHMGPAAVPFLMRQLTLKHTRLHNRAIAWLNRFPHVQVTTDFDRFECALSCLRLLGPDAEAAVPDLIKLARHPNLHTSQSAVILLGDIHRRPESTVPLLTELARSDDLTMRDAAVQALGNFGPAAQSAVPVLLASLPAESNFLLRGRIATVLEQIADLP